MLFLVVLALSALSQGFAHPYVYPSRVAVNPCGFAYPLRGLGSKSMWRYQPVRDLQWRISTIVKLIKFKEGFEVYNPKDYSWIPDDSTFENIADIATGLPTINRSLKYFSVAFDILEPHYSGRIYHTCNDPVENFMSVYANHTMLVCETDEAMRLFGANPTMDYPTLNIDVPDDWAATDPKSCTVNGLFTVGVLEKYKQFLTKFENLLKLLVTNMKYIQ